MTSYPKIAVIIVNYNGFDLTKECIESVRNSTYEPLSIVVVDNASTDNSISNLKKFLKPNEKLIELTINGGYPYGNNIGMQYAFQNGAEHAFIINNDIVVDKNCIKHLYEAVSSDGKIGIIGPKVLYYSNPDTIHYAGFDGRINKAIFIRIGLDQKDTGQYEKLVDTLYQDGCALLLNKTCYDKVGGFDAQLLAYWDETDLCMRVRKSGFRVCCQQKARVWHKLSATWGAYFDRPVTTYYLVRNSFIFYRRYLKSLDKLWVIFMLLLWTPYRFAYIAFKGKNARIKNLWMLVIATLIGILTSRKYPSDMFAPIKAVKQREVIRI